jgi:hypothetical protein
MESQDGKNEAIYSWPSKGNIRSHAPILYNRRVRMKIPTPSPIHKDSIELQKEMIRLQERDRV